MLNDYPLPINFVNCKSRTDIGLNRSFVLQKQCIVHSCSHLVLFEQPFSIIVRSAKFLCFNHFDLSTRPQKMLCSSRNPFTLSTSYNKLFLDYLQFQSNKCCMYNVSTQKMFICVDQIHNITMICTLKKKISTCIIIFDLNFKI